MARIVCMGTPDFALPSMKGLIAAHEVCAVVTQPDRPAGRNKQVRQSPVKRLALSAGIPVFQPKRLRQPEAIEALSVVDADLFIVVAFGQILPKAVLDLPKHGTLNVHASLLPRWRGAAPIQAAIRAGDKESGITIMLLDAGLDTGPLLAKQRLAFAPDETGKSLHDRLALLGADLLMETLPRYLNGLVTPQPQDDNLATYAPQIQKVDGDIDWTMSALEIERLVRAFTPWPGTYTRWKGKQLKIMSGRSIDGQAPAGQVVEHGGAIAIGTGDGLYLPAELQISGKTRLHIADFVNGHRGFVGSQLGMLLDTEGANLAR